MSSELPSKTRPDPFPRPADLDDLPGAIVTGSPAGIKEKHRAGTRRESKEREAAVRTGEARARAAAERRDSPRDPYSGIAQPGVAHRAFAALAENVRDYAIFLMDPDGIITFWGEGAHLIKWWTKDQAEGAHLRLLYPDDGAEDGTAAEHLQTAAETGEYTGEGHRIRSDGSTFWAGVTLTALRDPQGALLGFAKVTRDLTARRAAEAARSAAFEAAEESNRAKSQFLATMSHELRTPLNAIMAYADLLGMEVSGPLTETHQEQIGKIRTSSQHLLGIIEDVLDLSRIDSGRMVVARRRLRVETAISEALMMIGPQAEARGVNLDRAVSAFATDHPYWGDEDRVRQILLNLLSNAFKFTKPGGRVTLSADTAAEPPATGELKGPGPWVRFSVADTGQGISPHLLEAVFEPFVQEDMTFTRQHGGTGLGLAISRRLARLMDGDLIARSEVGLGSCFTLWLPAVSSSEAVEASA